MPEPSAGSDALKPASKPSATPTLSVVMTAFNSAAHLDASIASLLAQTFTDFELLIVDDASTDDDATVRTIETWQARDPRIRMIRRKANGGTYQAKNAALALARGRYITCHDSDDWAFPDRFAREVRILERRPKLMAVQSAWVRMTQAGRFVPMRWGAFVHENPASLMFRREVVDVIGPFDGARTGADTEFRERLRLFFGPNAYAYLNKPLTIGRYRTDSLTTAGGAALDDDLVSPERVAYWAVWSEWHADCAHRGAIATDLPLRGLRLPPYRERACG
jgi:glycosyltransferase involved in cell wall biosynthesis